MNPIVTQAWLRQHLDDLQLRIVDCRFVLGRPGAGRDAYIAAHIAGAAFLDLDADLAAPVGDGSRGRHPLPSPERFARATRAAGISNRSNVVAYDDAMTGGAARLWWLLRHFGHDDVRVLDGGFAAWDGPVRSGGERIAPGDFEVRDERPDTVDLDDVAARLHRPGRVLVDARLPQRYRGEVEPIDPVPGHIPGAVNAPFDQPLPQGLVDADDDIVVYCGSGVTAAVVALRLAAAGRADVKLYPGSYSEWTNRGLPVETGAQPGAPAGG